jgi:GNAT superfamily N-acetyltransferase
VSYEWRSERVAEIHDPSKFDSGTPELDLWLRSQALRADRQGTARTYVWTSQGSPLVRAYFSIAPTSVQRAGLPRSASGGHSQIPSYLLAKLALDRRLQGRGLGTELLLDALQRVDAAVSVSGGRLLVVDPAGPQARDFYLHQGFSPITGSDRLFLRTAALRALFGPGRASGASDAR